MQTYLMIGEGIYSVRFEDGTDLQVHLVKKAYYVVQTNAEANFAGSKHQSWSRYGGAFEAFKAISSMLRLRVPAQNPWADAVKDPIEFDWWAHCN